MVSWGPLAAISLAGQSFPAGHRLCGQPVGETAAEGHDPAAYAGLGGAEGQAGAFGHFRLGEPLEIGQFQ